MVIDYSWRLAVAAEQEHFDVLAAHSYRRSGNYFAGTKGADAYRRDDWFQMLDTTGGSGGAHSNEYRAYLANIYKPGTEVLNTHSEMTTTLLKGRLELPHNQELSLSWMNTEQIYGESNSSIIRNIKTNPDIVVDMGGMDDIAYQFNSPASVVDQDTWKLGYSWNPDNPLIDFQAGAWATQSFTVRHQNGSYSYQPMEADFNYNDYVRCSIWPDVWPERSSMYEWSCNRYYDPSTNPYATDPDYRDTSIDGTLVDRSREEWTNDRYGLNVRNRFQLSPDFALTLSADAQHETAEQWDASTEELALSVFEEGYQYMGLRAGTRREYNAGMQMEWFPTDTVMITGGLKWSRYWSYDDFRDEKRREDQGWSSREKVRYKAVNYGLYMTDEQTDQYNAYLSRQSEIDAAQRRGTLTDEQRAFAQESNAWIEQLTGGYISAAPEEREANSDRVFYGAYLNSRNLRQIGGATYLTGSAATGTIGGSINGIATALVPYDDGDHRGFRERNPFYNGSIDLNETVTTPDGKVLPKYLAGDMTYNGETGELLGATRKILDEIHKGSTAYEDMDLVLGTGQPDGPVINGQVAAAQQYQRPQKRRNEAWAPMLGITWFMTPHNRVYARYSEYVRFPSIWEDGQASMSLGYGYGVDTSGYRMEPERTRNIELGYVQDLTPWLSNVRMADVRLNYYRQPHRELH